MPPTGPFDGPSQADLTPALFRRFGQIAYDKAGIDLRDGKEALVAARVAKRQRALGLATFKDYLRFLEQDASGEELIQFLDSIATNFTSFFREEEHFRLLGDWVRELVARGAERLRFWSAASSSGEEPYSMAITILEALEGRSLDAKILATDISTKILSKAQAGFYETKAVADVPGLLRSKYFLRGGRRGSDRDVYEVAPGLRELVTFKRLNLAAPPYPMRGPIDMIFIRNVMIYFDQRVRQNLVSEAERLLSPGGYLVVGHTETLNNLETGLRIVRPSIYRKMG